MNRTIIRRVRLTPDEDAALTNKLAGTEFSKWVRDEIGKFVATSGSVATNKDVATKSVRTNVPTLKKDASVHAVKDELNKQLKSTNVVATVEDVPTGEKGSINLMVNTAKKAKLPDDYVMAKNIRTKPIDIKSTEKVSIEYAGEKLIKHTCTGCQAKIKKGFLCNKCLK